MNANQDELKHMISLQFSSFFLASEFLMQIFNFTKMFMLSNLMFPIEEDKKKFSAEIQMRIITMANTQDASIPIKVLNSVKPHFQNSANPWIIPLLNKLLEILTIFESSRFETKKTFQKWSSNIISQKTANTLR